jgi:RecJ-like exonuclease
MKRFVFGLLLVVGFLVPVVAVVAEDETPVVAARDLVSLYRENEIRFNKNHLNKRVQVTGVLERVSVSKGAPILTLQDGSLMGMFSYCRASELDAAADLDKGDTVTVVGTCEVALGKITLSDCVIKVKK